MNSSLVWDVLRWEYSWDVDPTSFDVPDMWDLSDEEIWKYIQERLKEDLSDSESFEKFTRIYSKVLKYLENELFYTEKELKRFKRKEFSDISDVVCFLKETQNKNWRMNCVIAKVFQAFYDADAEFNERVLEVREKTQWVIDGKLILPLRISQSNDDELVWEEIFEYERWSYRKIPYKIKKRLKSTESSVSKEIRDPKYFTIDRTSDLHGLTFEVERKEDILPLMEMVSWYVFKKWEFEVKNDKGMFSFQEVEENTEISEGFKARIALGTKERDKPESGDVVDIKLVTPSKKWSDTRNMNMEIKFTVVKNRNEKGLNMHGVYNYIKKISERIRLEWFVSFEYIDLVAKRFVDNIPELLAENVGRPEREWDDPYPYKAELFNELKRKKLIHPDVWHSEENFTLRNRHVKSHIDGRLVTWIRNYFLSKLISVNVNGWNNIHYTNSRALKMSENGIGVNMKTHQL